MGTTRNSNEAISVLEEARRLAQRIATWDRHVNLGAPSKWLDLSHAGVTDSLSNIAIDAERLHEIKQLEEIWQRPRGDAK